MEILTSVQNPVGDSTSAGVSSPHELELWKQFLQGGTDGAAASGTLPEIRDQAIEQGFQRKLEAPQYPPRAHVEKLCDEINLVRQAAWAGWQESRDDKVKTTEKSIVGGPGGGREENTLLTESVKRDASFLRIIIECNKREAALRGIEKSGQSSARGRSTSTDIDALIRQIEAVIAVDAARVSKSMPLPDRGDSATEGPTCEVSA